MEVGKNLPAFCGDNETDYVFASYSRKDKDEVFRLIEALNNKNYKVWYDGEGRTIPRGSDWNKYLENRVRTCSQFYLFLSIDSITSKNVKDEIKWANKYNKKIVPIFVKNKAGYRDGISKIVMAVIITEKEKLNRENEILSEKYEKHENDKTEREAILRSGEKLIDDWNEDIVKLSQRVETLKENAEKAKHWYDWFATNNKVKDIEAQIQKTNEEIQEIKSKICNEKEKHHIEHELVINKNKNELLKLELPRVQVREKLEKLETLRRIVSGEIKIKLNKEKPDYMLLKDAEELLDEIKDEVGLDLADYEKIETYLYNEFVCIYNGINYKDRTDFIEKIRKTSPFVKPKIEEKIQEEPAWFLTNKILIPLALVTIAVIFFAFINYKESPVKPEQKITQAPYRETGETKINSENNYDSLFAEGLEHLGKKEFEKAKISFMKAKDLPGSSNENNIIDQKLEEIEFRSKHEEYLKNARAFIKAYEIKMARDILDKIIKYVPDTGEPFYLYGSMLENENKTGEALKNYRMCLDIEKTHKDAQKAIALIENNNKKMDIRKNAKALLSGSRYTEAVEILEEYKTSFSEDTDSIVLLAQAYEKNEELDKAVEFYMRLNDKQKIENLNKLIFDKNLSSGMDAIIKKDYANAVIELQKAVSLNKESGKAIYNLGIAYEGTGKYDEAIKLYLESIQKFNDSRTSEIPVMKIKIKIGDLYYDKKDHGEAVKLYEEYVSSNTTADVNIASTEKYFKLINIIANYYYNGENISSGDMEKAVNYYKKILSSDKKNKSIVTNIVKLYCKMKNCAEAEKLLEETILLVKDDIILKEKLYTLYLEENKNTDAIRILKDIMTSEHPEEYDNKYNFLIGKAYYNSKDFANKKKYFDLITNKSDGYFDKIAEYSVEIKAKLKKPVVQNENSDDDSSENN